MDNVLFGQDILSASQFTREQVDVILSKAREMQRIVETNGATDILHGKIMTALFYEPSSRTFGSFVAAAQRLGGGFIPLQGVTYSSVSKGETLEDTVRTFAAYSDALVIRYPHIGGAAVAAEMLDIPVINAGDGNGEHPTQALLDMYTISNHIGSIAGSTIALVGDLLNGRTVHSLIQLLSLYKPKMIHCIAPGELQIPEEYIVVLKGAGVGVTLSESLDEVLPDCDVLYVTRVQKERFRDLDVYERLKHRYVISTDTMRHFKKTGILMHPFPRVGEILPEVDSDPRSVYLREQIQNGMFVRMALLALVLTK